jgi:phosphatidylglycerophosphate synthase
LNEDSKGEGGVGYVRVVEIHRTIRTVVICATILLGLAIIAYVAVKLLNKPPWLQIAIILLAPSGLLVTLFRVHRRYIRVHNERLRRLEAERDPGRTSSGLEKNGSSQYGH